MLSLSLLQGKVRDTYDLGDKIVIVTTDRQSAFDRLLASVPFKGQVRAPHGLWRNTYNSNGCMHMHVCIDARMQRNASQEEHVACKHACMLQPKHWS